MDRLLSVGLDFSLVNAHLFLDGAVHLLLGQEGFDVLGVELVVAEFYGKLSLYIWFDDFALLGMDSSVFLLVLLIGGRFALGLNDLRCTVLYLFGIGFRMLIFMGVNEGIRPWFRVL